MSLNILTINEVSAKIKRKNFVSTKNWLLSNNITIHKEGKQLFVFEIDVDTHIDKKKVLELRRQFPNTWQEIYRKIVNDDAVYEMVIHSIGDENIMLKPTTKIKPISATENELLKKYNA